MITRCRRKQNEIGRKLKSKTRQAEEMNLQGGFSLAQGIAMDLDDRAAMEMDAALYSSQNRCCLEN